MIFKFSCAAERKARAAVRVPTRLERVGLSEISAKMQPGMRRAKDCTPYQRGRTGPGRTKTPTTQ